MRIFMLQLRKELSELWATRRLIIILAVMVAFGFLSPLTAELLPDLLQSMGEDQALVSIQLVGEVTARDAIDQYVRNMAQIVMLLTVLMSFSVVVNEREKGMMTLMFPHPLPRPLFILAKFVALSLVFTIGTILSGSAAYFYTVILFDAPDIAGFAAMIGLITLHLVVIISLSVLASTLAHNTAMAAVLAFGFVALLLLLGTFTAIAPSKLIEWGANLAKGVETSAYWEAVFTAFAILVGSMLLACGIIRRQEIQ